MSPGSESGSRSDSGENSDSSSLDSSRGSTARSDPEEKYSEADIQDAVQDGNIQRLELIVAQNPDLLK